MPAVAMLSYGLMRLIGLPLPTPQFPIFLALELFPMAWSSHS
jgi:hypothetical protein